jgi:hypothetical protein
MIKCLCHYHKQEIKGGTWLLLRCCIEQLRYILLLVVIIGLMVTSAVAKASGGLRGGGFLGGRRAAGTGGIYWRGRLVLPLVVKPQLLWHGVLLRTSTFWLLFTSFIFLIV